MATPVRPEADAQRNAAPFSSATQVRGPHGLRPGPPSPLRIPTLVGYEDLQPLGEGGMGIVYRARDTRLKRTVALKMLRPESFTLDRLARFRREAEALARLQHPHIVQLFSVEEQNGQPFLVLEFVGGGTLEQILSGKHLDPHEVARLIAILARALQRAHASGVTHRDLKPSNVLLAAPVEGNSGTVFDGFPKVSDFGLAQLADAGGHTLAGMILGTPAYMAPEQAEGRNEEVGPASDVWALGMILYQCLAGRLPFETLSPEETLRQGRFSRKQPPPLSQANVPPPLKAICKSCLAPLIGNRPTAGELALRLEDYLANPESARRRARQRGSRRLRPGFLVAALLAVLLGGMLGILLRKLPEGAQEESREAAPESASPGLQVESLRIVHALNGGVMGETIFGARVGSGVRVDVTLSGPGHAFVVALNTDGSESLLWPQNGTGKAGETVPPPQVAHVEVPGAEAPPFLLGAGQNEGMQGFLVVASRNPLPPFESWRKRLGDFEWGRHPGGRDVFIYDGRRVDGYSAEMGRHQELFGPLPNVLVDLGRQVKALPGIDAVRLVVFPLEQARRGR